MIEHVENYLNRIAAATSQTEKVLISDELQAFYKTLNEEEYQLVKERILTPRLNNLKLKMAEIDALIDELLPQEIRR